MSDLSPAAQAVLDAANSRTSCGPDDCLTDMDANRWASEFVSLYGGDHELMRAWFANALMCGWDNHYWTTSEYKASINNAISGKN